MKLRPAWAALAGAAIALSACADMTPEQKHEMGCVAGTASGAVLGGLAGSLIGGGTGQLIATGAGAAIGGFAGNRLTCG
ncbi:glycine zipper 2TM domain-containing protein [Amaricoccus sp.]|uniref:glycine zipper 2TM domain-containing protein n=1 Tax=Amaricoccus sp. TaxID=1872485 RepID=UPI001B4B7B0A|nr:glycine zipper 2TM domain-containing protein [Amaricoccus sp.]MBP7003476.1 glycine zipper 2TM domain-containing protein [Amaricoccus sp.]